MKTMFVYILQCSDSSYYTGVTNNIDRRLSEHKEGENRKAYTFKRRPVKLVFLQQFNDPTEAIDFEKQIKGWRRDKKEAIIQGKWELLPELSKKKASAFQKLENSSTQNQLAHP